MELHPKSIYENYRNNSLDKVSIIRLLITLIENNEDDVIRKDCIETLNKIDSNDDEIFRILENVLLSEANEDLRSSAAKVLGNKFLKKALNPFLWVLHYEDSYKCLITILKSFQESSNSQILSLLVSKIQKIPIDKFSNCLTSFLVRYNTKELLPEEFIEILINHVIINYLQKKFQKLNYKTKNGLVTELDFSSVDNLVVGWRDRESLQDHSVITGIEELKNLKNVLFFPHKWTCNNELTYKCSIALIKALERLNNDVSKNTFIYQFGKVFDKNYKLSISTLFKQSRNLPVSKLSNMLRNYLTISFLKKKYSSLEYRLNNGEVISIHIRRENIISLPNFIKYMSSLRSITLKECSLYTIPRAIGSFTNLKVLDLEENNLKILPKEISSLKSLRLLNLKKNQLVKLPYPIGRVAALQYLNLESNDLEKLPSSIGNLSSLKYLSLKDNKLKGLPSSIGNLKSLQILDLSSNKLKKLPRSIGLISLLETLKIDNNELEDIPISINSVSSLNNLSLEDNNITGLPDSIGLLKSLKILKLGWNKITDLPDSIGSLNSLKYLRIPNNKLEALPKTLCYNIMLEFLDVSNNNIKSLPMNIGNLKSLQTLILSDNQIKTLPKSIYLLNYLQKFDIKGNHIEYLSKSPGKLSSLRNPAYNKASR
ncbi:MAG: leucine-rich repeat domain-containing protein [Promethearchaeota archaeon]|jgi:Leucine-rich repeat (LRR) protein